MSGTTDQRMAYNPHDFKDQIDWKIMPHAKFDHFDKKVSLVLIFWIAMPPF